MSNSSEKFNIRRRCHGGVAMAIVAATVLATPVSGSLGTPAHGQTLSAREHKPDVSFLEIDKDIKLRRMVVRNANPKGTVLFLHGFPETLYAWKDIALTLAGDYEVHAFDWPGFGLSSRPTVARFSYAPRDYARVLYDYIRKAGIDTSKLTIYATDIGALPALLLAQEKPGIATSIIVGDFAPFDRPQYMYESLQKLKAGPLMEQARDQLNKNRDDILENAFRRGLPKEAQFDVPHEFKDDMSRAWGHGAITTTGCLLALLRALYARPEPLRIKSRAARNPGEGHLGREGSVHQERDGDRTCR